MFVLCIHFCLGILFIFWVVSKFCITTLSHLLILVWFAFIDSFLVYIFLAYEDSGLTIQAAFSEIDFNFMDYAQQRLAEYHRLKRVLFLL
jgi:hypothetical protein